MLVLLLLGHIADADFSCKQASLHLVCVHRSAVRANNPPSVLPSFLCAVLCCPVLCCAMLCCPVLSCLVLWFRSARVRSRQLPSRSSPSSSSSPSPGGEPRVVSYSEVVSCRVMSGEIQLPWRPSPSGGLMNAGEHDWHRDQEKGDASLPSPPSGLVEQGSRPWRPRRSVGGREGRALSFEQQREGPRLAASPACSLARSLAIHTDGTCPAVDSR